MRAEWEWKLTPAFAAVDRGRATIQRLGEQVLQASNRNVPVDSGDLRGSGRVTMDHNRAIIHYDDWKAVIVHERLNVRHTVGGPKFLENAVTEIAPQVERELAQAMRM